MITNYRRFNELRLKAKEQLKGRGVLEDQLTNAVIEISYMRQNEVPEHLWEGVQSIIKACSSHEQKKQEGRFRASINEMTNIELKSLKRAIELL